MSTRRIEGDELPIPPGESPFGLKGQAYRSFFDYMVHAHGIDQRTIAADIPNPRLSEYARQPFIAATWYDLLPLIALLNHAGTLAKAPQLLLAKEMAMFGAARDVKGLYRAILKVASPETVLRSMPLAAKQYFRFGTLTCEQKGPREWINVRTGVPVIAAPWYKAMAIGFQDECLRIAGAKEPRTLAMKEEVDGSEAGVPTATILFNVRWA